MMLAYSFLAPAFAIIGLFGLFPLAFAAYESTLRGLNKIVGSYDGLGNYVKAVDNFIYILAFWMAAGLFFYAGATVARAFQERREEQTNPLPWLLPGTLTAAGVALFTRFVYVLLPEMLLIPSKLRGQGNTQEAFRGLVVETWWSSKVQIALWLAILVLAVGAGWALLVSRRMPTERRERLYFMPFFQLRNQHYWWSGFGVADVDGDQCGLRGGARKGRGAETVVADCDDQRRVSVAIAGVASVE